MCAQIIGITNQKGGVGKTTNTLNIAGAAADSGLDVLVIDTDPQGYLTNTVGFRDQYGSGSPSLYDAFLEPSDYEISDLVFTGSEFDVIPANVDMFRLEQDLVAAGWKPRQRLNTLLNDSRLANDYDYVFIDAPPSLGPINDNVLLAVDGILVPSEAAETSIWAIDHLLRQIDTLEDRYDGTIDIYGIIMSNVEYPLDGEQKASIAWFDEEFADMLNVFEVRNRVAIRRAASNGLSIFGSDEESDMEAVYRELVDDLETNDD